MKRASAKRAAPTALQEYHRKRDLKVSGEPDHAPPKRSARSTTPSAKLRAAEKAAAQALRYVIQKHDATRLHYDLRLEMEGVLRSWAVPKGLPAKPGDKVLAVEVEDHPLSYADFEGVIPAGNYGAGTVMVWDHGHYLTEGGDPVAEHKKGHIDFALAGAKCAGSWTLVRMRRGDEARDNWLLIKRHEPTRRTVIKRVGRDRSVQSQRTLLQIAREEAPQAKKRWAAQEKRMQ